MIRDEELHRLVERLGHRFRNPALLQESLTHASYLQEHPEIPRNNQRLEFLGDAVLQLILTEELYQLFPDEREGVLSRRRAAVTKGRFLAQLAADLGLAAHLLLSPSEDQSGGRTRLSILEDACEAIVGAIYLDAGFDTTKAAVLRWYGHLPERLAALEGADNPKGRLQERVQPIHGNNALRYSVTATHGAAHAREYEVEVFLLDQSLGCGRGSSKKEAEEAAARVALMKELPPLGTEPRE